jgi:hypothetical protein
MQSTEMDTPHSLSDSVGQILSLDRKLGHLHDHGRHPGDPEWLHCDELLTEIGVQLYAEGGERRMHAALDRAHMLGLRGHYVERHWNGIGTWVD